ncbi:MAG: L-lactate dehydrogenase [Candidatus Microthrix parvicella]|nr:L-lactate dehydrogenase [Candidatus Microthrix sp.]
MKRSGVPVREAEPMVTLNPLGRDRPLGLAAASVRDYREVARRRLPRQLFDYIDGGAYEEATLAANTADLEAISLRQRVLRDVSTRTMSTTVLGEELSLPVLLAPVGLAGMFANRAEVAAARAAEHAGVSFVESTVSICSLEEVAAATKRAPWFQLYVMRDRGYAENLMARAQAVGCRVLVLTADLAVVGARYRDTRNGLGGRVSPVGAAIRGLDRVSHPRWVWEVGIQGKPHTFGNLTDAVPGGNSPDDFRDWVDAQFDPSVTWDDLAWVRDHWDGPVVLKGILDPEDARAAADAGVDAVVVSNHGGRQLDAVPSTAAALPAVVEAVGDRIEVLVDGGVRSGLDLLKMMAMGAKACLVGRPWAWAVAAKGEAGVAHLLEILRDELAVAMALTGTTDVADLGPDSLLR